MRDTVVRLVALLLLAGCSNARPPRQDAFYRIVVPPAEAIASIGGAFVLRIEPVRAQGVYADSTLLGRGASDTAPLYRHFYDRWAQPPAQLLTVVFGQRMVAALGAARVRIADQHGESQWTLTSTLRGLERVQDGEQVSAHLALEFVLQDSPGHVLDTFTYDHLQAVADRELSSYVGVVDQLAAQAADLAVSRVRALAQAADARPARSS